MANVDLLQMLIKINCVQAQILGNLGETERAEEVLTEILQRNPHNPDAMAQMSNVLGQQNRHLQVTEITVILQI